MTIAELLAPANHRSTHMQRFKKHITDKHGGGPLDQIPITANSDRKYDGEAAQRYLRRGRAASTGTCRACSRVITGGSGDLCSKCA